MNTEALRDIDYAATAVKTAIVEKFGRKASLENLQLVANERTILMQDGPRRTENTRDNLLAAVRKAETYEELWRQFPHA
jgi:hypothetical protein